MQPVNDVFPAIAGERANLGFIQCHFPDLVGASHGDVERIFVYPERPRAVDWGRFRFSHVAFGSTLSGRQLVDSGPRSPGLRSDTRDGRYLSGFQIDLAQQMIFSVRHVEHFAMQRDALRMVKAGLLVTTIFSSHRTAADGVQQLSREISDHEPVVIAVGDKQPLAGLIGQYFPGETQGCVFLV